MRFAAAVGALALSSVTLAQDNSWATWEDAPISTTYQATTTVTKTLEFVHTQTMYGKPSNGTTYSAPSKTSAVLPESTPAKTSAATVATPSNAQGSISGATAMSYDMVLAVVAAGAVAFWSS